MRIYAAGVAAVDPRRLVAAALAGATPAAASLPETLAACPHLRLLAVGKAACGMAAEVEAQLGAKLRDELIIAPAAVLAAANASPSSRIRVLPGAHPIPDESSIAAGRAALAFAAEAQPDEIVLLALSGGASALMVAPADGLTLLDKVAITSALMRAGATIRELNAVRKHLSALKGGGLLRALAPGARLISLIISDVPGNDLATIGSGPSAPDPSTYADAIGVLKRRGVWGRAPEPVRHHLERGLAGEIAETLKSGDSIAARAQNLIIGDNSTAVAAASAAAAALGYEVDGSRALSGEANELGAALAAYTATIERQRVCVVAGGEPVVTMSGRGRGGRAQQAALAMALELARRAPEARIAALFAGTDGVDGPTDAAGAILSPATIRRAAEAGLDAAAALARNDAYPFFKALGDLVMTGPTGTNVADLFVALVNY
jgi:hydroxypyruvate reductase